MYKSIIEKWSKILNLEEKDITTEEIWSDQVIFPEDLCDKTFVGVDLRTLIIYHDRKLTEEDIVHELVHVWKPDMSETQVVQMTSTLLNLDKCNLIKK